MDERRRDNRSVRRRRPPLLPSWPCRGEVRGCRAHAPAVRSARGLRRCRSNPPTFPTSNARLGQLLGELQRGLSAELHDDAFRFLEIDDLQDVFEREWLEVEAIRRVVV